MVNIMMQMASHTFCASTLYTKANSLKHTQFMAIRYKKVISSSCCCCWLSGGDRFLSHHELRPSVGPVLNPYPHNGVCVCVCIGTRPRCPHMHMHMRVLWAVFVLFILVRRPHCASRPQHWPSCLNGPIQAGESVDQWSHVPTGTVVDSTHHCCYECYHRSQFTEDNAEPSFLPGINSLCQFTVPPQGHLCQPHLCGRGYNSGQPTSLTQNGIPWINAIRVALPYTWLPAKHFPHHSAPAKVGRPLAQDPSHWHAHSGSTSPQPGNEINFPRGHRGMRTQD